MSLNTSLKGRFRNINFLKSHLFPFCEAVVNPIDERIKNDQEFEISKAYLKEKIIRSIQKFLIHKCVTVKRRITENMITEK